MNASDREAHSEATSRGWLVDRDDLPETAHAHELLGADYGSVPISLILVDAPPGEGPAVHRHPYAEVFVVESGEAAFQLGGETFTARGGQIVVGPPNVPHGFRNAGAENLRLTAIHAAARFDTEWVHGPDEVWSSPPRGDASATK